MSDLDDLARRLGAELTARGLWGPGMQFRTQRDNPWHWTGRGFLPVEGDEVRLDCAATAGVLLSLLTYPWRIGSPSGDPHGDGRQDWRIVVAGMRPSQASGATLGEAAARALLALWEISLDSGPARD